MLPARKIIHIDLDAFFCAVEEQRDRSLVGKPFAVGGRPEERGVVASCSYAARQRGIHSAMAMAHALRLCPNLIIVSSRHAEYARVSHQVMDLLHQLTPLVEQISIDEAFLDVSDLYEPLELIAARLQKDIFEQLGLPSSLGGASNKLVAKIATDVGKAANRSARPPMAITIVPAGDEAAFLAPLPVQALWGVGPKTAARLKELQIEKIGDLATRTEQEMVEMFGKNGSDLIFHARGIDDRPIITQHEIKSISQETTFAKDIRDQTVLEHTLKELAESVGLRLRRENLRGVTVKLKLRWPDFATVTRQITLPEPVDQDREIYTAARGLFHKLWKPGKAVRLLGVGVSGFPTGVRQLSLWECQPEKNHALQDTLDDLQKRFGRQVVQRGTRLNQAGTKNKETHN